MAERSVRGIFLFYFFTDLYRSCIFFRDTDLDNVLQISNVFTNVSKGEVAKTGDLQKAFNTKDVNDIIKEVRIYFHIYIYIYSLTRRQILKKGELQVGEKERDHDLASLRKEIATLISEKCVDPSTQHGYSTSVIEKAMAEAGFSVKQNKTAKSQVRTKKKNGNRAPV